MTQTKKHKGSGMPRLKGPSISPMILVLLVIALAVTGVMAVTRFVRVERDRELLSWQNRLNLIADSRAADIGSWLDRYFKELGSVADNPSLQLYLSELLEAPNTRVAEDPAQAVFLRNLISMTADRLGFIQPPSKEIKSIAADVVKPSGVGLAILNKEGKILVSTAGLPAFEPSLSGKIQKIPEDEASLIDIFKTEDGRNRLGFVLPIYPIQSDASTSKPIGRLVGIKNVDDDLFKLLRHPGVTDRQRFGLPS